MRVSLRLLLLCVFLAGALLAHGQCIPSPTSLCVSNSRYRVTVRWTTPQGATGSGQAVALTSDTGYFWFFDRQNVEVVVKVLNACGLNNRYWVFAAGLTNVDVAITVTDTATGAQKVYRNVQGTPFKPIQDTAAFACSGTPATTPPPASPVASSGALLLNNRYSVETRWKTPDGKTGSGRAVPLTSDTGYFWFFDEKNVEVIVKSLDACGFNDRFWVFAGGLTNVEVTMTVRDTVSGTTRTYSNTQGRPFAPIQDTGAFATCIDRPAYSLVPSPEDPLFLRAVTPDGDRIEYFGPKDAAGNPLRTSNIDVWNADGSAMSFTLDAQSRPVQAMSSDGVPITVRWLSNNVIVFTITTADGAQQVTVTTDLNAPAVSPIRTSGSRTRTRRARSRTLSIPNFAVLDLPGTERWEVEATTDSRVSVQRCELPVNNAVVSMLVSPTIGLSYRVPGLLAGDGQYRVPIPTSPDPDHEEVGELCEKVANVAGQGCNVVQAIGPGATAVCARVALLPHPSAKILFAVCEAFFTAATAYCDTLGAGPDPAGPSLVDVICGELPDILDRSTSQQVTLTPSATVPGVSGTFVAPSQVAPGRGPFPNFTINAGGAVRIGNLFATPADPGPGDDYVVTVEILCAAPGTLVEMTIEGTDGYLDSTLCSVSGDSSCFLDVPGAEEGVIDVVTTRVLNGPSRQIVLVF